MRLRTLGELRFEGTDFKRGRPLLLLAYLSLEGPQERRFLAELFWPQSTTALKNLTTVLSRLKKLDAALVETEAHTLSTQLNCDAKELLLAFEQENYSRVIDCYTGRFLEGLSNHDLSSELEEWLYSWRESLATKVRLARLHQAEALAKEKQFKEAAKEAEKAYFQASAGEPTDKDLVRIHTLLIAADSRLAYEVEKEATTYGLELSLTSEKAKQQFIDEAAQTETTPLSIKHNLAKQSTVFVGRQAELESLHEQLKEPKCRLLSLIGPGGMGKTRLALALAEKQLNEVRFRDGIYFVSFVAVTAPEQIIVTLGDVLGLSFAGPLDPKVQLLSFLKDKKLLLILDNLEHLLRDVAVLAEILAFAADVTLVATSREPLHLKAEHVFDIAGLTLTDDASQASEAVQLFVQQAQMQQAEFTVSEANQSQIMSICQQLDGMPLALELAASWLRVLPLEAIFEELKQSLDFLEARSRDLPDRHKSMRAVFDYSWQLLTLEEQAALKKLAVFKGGFTREAAKDVASVSLLELASLIDKSFLTSAAHGRFRRHPLVIQYSQEKLNQNPQEKVLYEESHSYYFIQLMLQHKKALRSLERKVILKELLMDLPNIRKAWTWIVHQKDVKVVNDSVPVLYEILFERPRDAVEFFEYARQYLTDSSNQHALTVGILCCYQAISQLYFSPPEKTHALAETGHTLLSQVGNQEDIILGLKALGRSLWHYDMNNAAPVIEEGLRLAREIHSPEVGFFLQRLMLNQRNSAGF